MFGEDSTSKCEMEQPMDLSTTSRSAADNNEQATDLTLVSAREQCEPLNLSITTSRELPSRTNLSSNLPYQCTSQSTNQSTSQTKLYGCMSESKTQLVSSATCSAAFNEDCRPRVTASSIRRCQSYSPTSISSPSQYALENLWSNQYEQPLPTSNIQHTNIDIRKTSATTSCIQPQTRVGDGAQPEFCAVDSTTEESCSSTLSLFSKPSTSQGSFFQSLQCQICKREYKQARDYRAHMATHTNSNNLQCDICLVVLSNTEHYLTHLKSHGQKEFHSCEECGKYFRDKCTLRIHMRTHTGEKPYQCTICQKTFRQSGTYKRHIKIHEERVVLSLPKQASL